MEILFEIILPLLGEALLEGVFDALIEYGLDRTPRRRAASPVMAYLGLALLGATGGLLSLLVSPHAWIADPAARRLALVLVPVLAAGMVTAASHALPANRERRPARLRFLRAFVVVLALNAVRFAATA